MRICINEEVRGRGDTSSLFSLCHFLEDSNMHILHNTQYKYRPTKVYHLDAIISVGYRVKSRRGIAFRIWARKILKEYLIKGDAINERIRKEQIGELRQLVQVVGCAIKNQELPDTAETKSC